MFDMWEQVTAIRQLIEV